MSSRTTRLIAWLGALEYRFLEASLLLLLALNGVSVFARYVLNHAVGELFEIMILLSVATYWLGAASAERVAGHLGMHFLVSTFPPPARRVADLFRSAVIVGFLAVVTYSGIKLTASQFRFGSKSGILDMPLWMFSAFLPFGAWLLALRVIFPPRKINAHNEAML